MTYSIAQIDSFRNELTTLQAARTNLLSGRMAAHVVIDGDVVKYHRVDIPLLTKRIGELESILSGVDNAGEYTTSFKIISGKGL